MLPQGVEFLIHDGCGIEVGVDRAADGAALAHAREVKAADFEGAVMGGFGTDGAAPERSPQHF